MLNLLSHLLLYFTLAFSSAPAAPALEGPVILELIGDPHGGVELTICGHGFGPAPRIISWDDFESHADGDLVDGLRPPVGPKWQSGWKGDLRPRISAYRAVSGRNAARSCWNDGDDEAYSLAYWGWTGQGPFERLYYSYWRYLAGSGPAWESGSKNHKTIYLYGTGKGEHPQFLVGATMNGGVWHHSTNGGAKWLIPKYGRDQYAVPNHTLNWEATKGAWQRWEGYVELNRPFGQANDKVQLFHQCREIFSGDDLRLSEGGAYRDFRIGHLDNSYADYDSLYAYFDDLYVATSRARVELGDAPDFDDCTRRDIQVFTSWSDEEIRLRLRLPDGTDAPRHLFVVDAEGRTASIEIGP